MKTRLMYKPLFEGNRIFHSLREYFIHYSSISLKISSLGFDVQTFGFRQLEAKWKPNVTQKNSMEAKKPKVYGGYLIFIPKRDQLL